MTLVKLLVIVLVLVNYIDSAKWTIEDNKAIGYPCKNTKNIVTELHVYKNKKAIQTYDLILKFTSVFYLKLTFSEAVNVTLTNGEISTFTYLSSDSVVVAYRRNKKLSQLEIRVTGLSSKKLPYVTSLNIDGEEKCTRPDIGIYDDIINSPNGVECGQKQIIHTELITNSIMSKPGDWPWHAALYRMDKFTFDYKCGGTIISNKVVITAAHCLLKKGVNKVYPTNRLKLYLGKYNLNEEDDELQEKTIERTIIHKNFDTTNLNHDISLLKLSTEIEFNDHVQPICIWDPTVSTKLANINIYGTVVGWGYDENDRLSTQLRQATIPLVDGLTCIFSNSLFFGKYLNQYKFCAGYTNGTSACNGDSGGGFAVFVPNSGSSLPNDFETGSWYLRGIVSVAVSRRDVNICARKSYVLFTDVSKYHEWIQMHLTSDIIEEPFQTVEFSPVEHVEEETDAPAPEMPKCGRRVILHTQLMTNSEPAKQGDWPWHARIHGKDNDTEKYLCGGTLISKNIVITGVPCVFSFALNNVRLPKDMIVYLGSLYLKIIEMHSQIKEVSQIVIHENYKRESISPDIAIIKLKSNAIYGPLVQPACLWNKYAKEKAEKAKLYSSEIIGTVVGWGFNETGELSNVLKVATMPIVNDRKCALLSPIFSQFIDGRFCAGYANGTAPCNGDSGGGFMVFIPDSPDTTEDANVAGAWYLRGIVSVASTTKDKDGDTRCDSHNYVFCTDMETQEDWIQRTISAWIF